MITRIQKRLQERENEGGFTLVELLVVIIIIGILAAIAIPLYLNQQNKAKDSSAKADLNTIRTAVISAITENPSGGTVDWDAVTASADGGTTEITVGTGATATTSTAAVSPGNALAAPAAPIDISGTDPTIEITVTSATGTAFTIDENGSISDDA